MRKKDKITRALAIEIAIGLLVWLGLVGAKALGFLRTDWITILLGLLWVPLAVIVLLYIAAGVVDTIRWIREAAYRISTALTLKDAMHGMTLNALGPIYGVERQKGEPNRHYEQRIMYAAAKGGKIRMKRPADMPRPATGAALDRVAKKYDITRHKGESDKHLQDRVRAAITKNLNEQLEGGKA